MSPPVIIQGGMGAGVSGWPLAKAVSRMGQLGVVSGTALDTIFVRRLQEGDLGGHLRRALAQFPVPEIVQEILKKYFVPGGKQKEVPYALLPLYTATPSTFQQALTVVSNFAEVFLAKEGHSGIVGINYLEKIQFPLLASLYGAMLAGVSYVLIGAGIPREIPGVLDLLTHHQEVSIRLHVANAASEDDFRIRFDPKGVVPQELPALPRPTFLAIIASATLAAALAKKSTGKVDGFVIEGPTSGGHNAPPRGPLQLNVKGEPVYGSKDEVDLEAVKALGCPFWLAGSYGDPEQLKRARQWGAAGVQVGTAFAYCRESGLADEIKCKLLQKARRGEGKVFTDPVASPAGFPFKVVKMEGSMSEPEVCTSRPKTCDLGYLRHAYKKEDGSLGYRCPAEPVTAYVGKGGKLEETSGRKCLCNGLLATIGLPQRREDGYVEKPIVTSGDDLNKIARFLKKGETSYSAADVIERLLGHSS